jgi:hypothetical protein
MYEPIDVGGEALSLDYGIFPDQPTKSVSVRYWVHKNGIPGGGRPEIRYTQEELQGMDLVAEHQYTSDKLDQAVKLMIRTHIKDLRELQSTLVVDEATSMEWLEQAAEELKRQKITFK